MQSGGPVIPVLVHHGNRQFLPNGQPGGESPRSGPEMAYAHPPQHFVSQVQLTQQRGSSYCCNGVHLYLLAFEWPLWVCSHPCRLMAMPSSWLSLRSQSKANRPRNVQILHMYI